MTIEELQLFVREAKVKINEKYGANISHGQEVLSSMVKLSEEVGELAEQIMKRKGRQHGDKGAFELEDMKDEIADVIFAASMIACDMNIDLESALERKKEKILKKLG